MDEQSRSTEQGRTLITQSKDLRTLTHIIYGLHALSVGVGITTSASIVFSFLFTIPSLIAVALNYLNYSKTVGTWLESHFRWQIRTFWFAMFWYVCFWVLTISIIGIPLAIIVFIALCIWVFYRVARGWLRLNNNLKMYINDE